MALNRFLTNLLHRRPSPLRLLSAASALLIASGDFGIAQQRGSSFDPVGALPIDGPPLAASGATDGTPSADSLFVPIVPGATPVPTPTPEPIPEPVFQPSDIAAPAIQATPETVDIIEIQEYETVPSILPDATPRPTATPTRTFQPTSTTRRTTDVQEAMTGERLNQLMMRARTNRDSSLATQVGWANFERKDYPSAAMWFEQAISWNPNSGEAYYGLALTKFTQGDLSQAEAIAGYRANAYPKMRTLMGDIQSRRAVQDYEARQYKSVIETLDKVAEYRSLSRNEQIIRGWSYYYLKDTQSAANIFEKLYRSNPDKASAEGLYAALSRTKDWERLELVAAEVPGPLNEIYMTYDTENYYKSGLYLAAYESNEKAYPALENFNAPSAMLGFEYEQKSGQSGESKLQTNRTPAAQLKLYPADRVELTAQLARLILRSGDLAPNSNVGTPPDFEARIEANEESLAAGGDGVQIDEPYSYDPTVGFNDLYEVRARLQYQDWFSPYVEIGSTPLNAELSARLTGRVGAEYRHATGYVQGEFFSESIRESILSYVGLQDPYRDRQWGRVQETGGTVSVFQGFMENYTFFGKAKYGVITGTNTRQNDHLAFTGSISRLFDYEGFEYITLGPAVSYERYNNNQNFFTYGHGGYFSPEYIVQGLIEAQFLTSEGLNWLARGNIGAGAQQNQQATAAYFPLDPDGRDYPSTSSSTGIFLVNVEGGIMLTPEFMVGSKLGYAITADYNAGSATIYLRYFFEPRAGLFRSDLDMTFW